MKYLHYLVGLSGLSAAGAFSGIRAPLRPHSSSQLSAEWDANTSATGGGSGSLEILEFKIYPDGRVEVHVV